ARLVLADQDHLCRWRGPVHRAKIPIASQGRKFFPTLSIDCIARVPVQRKHGHAFRIVLIDLNRPTTLTAPADDPAIEARPRLPLVRRLPQTVSDDVDHHIPVQTVDRSPRTSSRPGLLASLIDLRAGNVGPCVGGLSGGSRECETNEY